ncbi:MAG: rhomboid family intramembrane serine protease, partial [Methanomassiliicoccales archaeon]|nr:rhomboid family intramembrane serine protease [Methanomassiliicoccales archaeon]
MDLLSLVCVGLIVGGLVLVYRRGYPLAQSLVLINLALFMLSIISAWGQPSYLLSPIQRELGFRPVYIGELENLFTVFTHMFVHSGLLHVLFNMLFLFLIGVPLEERVGRKAFALCFFIPGLLALFMET